MKPLSREERKRLASQASMTLVNLGTVRLYWQPARRRLIARSVYISRRFFVPADAVPLGIYEHPLPAREVLGDLDELLQRLPEPEPEPLAAAPEAEPEPALVAPADPCELPEPEAPRPRRRMSNAWLFAK